MSELRKRVESVSPLSENVQTETVQTEQQQGGLHARPMSSFLALPGPPLLSTYQRYVRIRIRRRKCGVCLPCLHTENCHTCSACLNRKIGKQKCKLRKCDQLKKRSDQEIIFYEGRNFQGRNWECNSDCMDTYKYFNCCNSIRVTGGHWVAYEKPNYMGYQYILNQGEYPEYQRWMGFNNCVGSCQMFLPTDMVTVQTQEGEKETQELQNDMVTVQTHGGGREGEKETQELQKPLETPLDLPFRCYPASNLELSPGAALPPPPSENPLPNPQVPVTRKRGWPKGKRRKHLLPLNHSGPGRSHGSRTNQPNPQVTVTRKRGWPKGRRRKPLLPLNHSGPGRSHGSGTNQPNPQVPVTRKRGWPYYNHLGSGPTVASIRELMETRILLNMATPHLSHLGLRKLSICLVDCMKPSQLDQEKSRMDCMETNSLALLQFICKEEVPPQQQERSPSLGQEDPQPLQIKEEQEELLASQEGEQLQGLEEADIIKLTYTPVPLKSEHDEEKPQSSWFNQNQDPESQQIKEEQKELFRDLLEAYCYKTTLHPVKYENDGDNTLSSWFNQTQDPESQQIKEEQNELFQDLEADGSKTTLHPVNYEHAYVNTLSSQLSQTQDSELLKMKDELHQGLYDDDSSGTETENGDDESSETDDSDNWNESGGPSLITLKPKKTKKIESLANSRPVFIKKGDTHENSYWRETI